MVTRFYSYPKPIDHCDTIANIEAIERNDLWPLLHEGDARIIHNSRRNYNPTFNVAGEVALGIRVYHITIHQPNKWPFTPFVITVKFTYDRRINRGHIRINASDTKSLYLHLFRSNGDYFSKEAEANEEVSEASESEAAWTYS